VQSSLIRRGVVDYDDMVVGVLLVQDTLQVEFIPEILGVVIRRYNYAEWQLFIVFTQRICLLKP
jgi:hypothetical protein